jgi:hypothetical protein
MQKNDRWSFFTGGEITQAEPVMVAVFDMRYHNKWLLMLGQTTDRLLYRFR